MLLELFLNYTLLYNNVNPIRTQKNNTYIHFFTPSKNPFLKKKYESIDTNCELKILTKALLFRSTLDLKVEHVPITITNRILKYEEKTLKVLQRTLITCRSVYEISGVVGLVTLVHAATTLVPAFSELK